MGRQKVTVEARIKKEHPEFVGEVSGLSIDQLNSRLAELAKQAEEVEQAKSEDEELEKAKEDAKQLSAPYRDAKKMIHLKSKYVIGLIKEKGGT